MLTSYALFHVVASVVAVGLFVALGRRRGMAGRSLLAVALAAVAGVYVGARLLHLALDRGWYAEDPWRIVSLRFVGFSLYGGLLGAGLIGYVVARRVGLPVARVADVAAVAAMVGVAVVRVGCFLNGCCFGRETDVAWGVTFPVGSPAWGRQVAQGDIVTVLFGGGAAAVETHPVHPTQLYEMLAALVCAVVAWRLGRRAVEGRLPEGVAFVVGAAAFTSFRFANWTLRVPSSTFDAPRWFYPSFYGLVLGVLVAVATVAVDRRSPVHSRAHVGRHLHLHVAGDHRRPDRRRQEG